MNLQLFLQQTGQRWTLKPGRTYVVGSGSDCDITVPAGSGIGSRHLQLRFDGSNQKWCLEDLSPEFETLVNGEPNVGNAVTHKATVQLGSNVVFTLDPERSVVGVDSSVPQPLRSPGSSAYSTATVRNNNFREVVGPTGSNVQRSGVSPSALATLSWADYVKAQVDQYEGVFMKLATKFALITGLRNTTWILTSKERHHIEGYVIPDFKGSLEAVVQAIEMQVGSLRQYEDTDCIASNLTDAHIANSESQGFTGVELFAIRRGKNAVRGDYRRFCVTSYHRVRNYLIVERYGPDLFVSWVTRFEPTPTPAVMILWLVLAVFLWLVMLSVPGGAGLFAWMPPILWASIYMLVPKIMESTGMLPKKANALLMIFLVVAALFFVFSVLGAMGLMRSYSSF
jgi:hypothetical protein